MQPRSLHASSSHSRKRVDEAWERQEANNLRNVTQSRDLTFLSSLPFCLFWLCQQTRRVDSTSTFTIATYYPTIPTHNNDNILLITATPSHHLPSHAPSSVCKLIVIAAQSPYPGPHQSRRIGFSTRPLFCCCHIRLQRSIANR